MDTARAIIRVKAMETKKTIVAGRRCSSPIFLICVTGPTRKKVLDRGERNEKEITWEKGRGERK